jgi:hypothetical protein
VSHIICGNVLYPELGRWASSGKYHSADINGRLRLSPSWRTTETACAETKVAVQSPLAERDQSSIMKALVTGLQHPAYLPVDFAGYCEKSGAGVPADLPGALIIARHLSVIRGQAWSLVNFAESGHCLRLSAVPVSNQWRLGCIGFRSHVMATVLSIDGPLLQGQSPCVKGLRTPGVTLRSLPTRGGGAGDQSNLSSGLQHCRPSINSRAHHQQRTARRRLSAILSSR